MKKTILLILSFTLILMLSACDKVEINQRFQDEEILKKEIESYISDFDLNISKMESQSYYTITLKVEKMDVKNASKVLDKTVRYLVPRMKEFDKTIGYQLWIRSEDYTYMGGRTLSKILLI